MNAPPQMGDRVRDIVTGRTGVLTGFCEYLWGCEQFLMYFDNERDKNNNPSNTWLDVGRLEIVERDAVSAIEYSRASDEAPIEGLEVTGEQGSTRRRTGLGRAIFAGADTEAPRR